MTDLVKLRELERAATPGEWVQDGTRLSVCEFPGIPDGETSRFRVIANVFSRNDREWLAALRNAAPRLLTAAEECERMRAENAKLFVLVYMPGQWRCPKCEFQLTQSNLNASDGSVTARDTPGDKCPNCDSALWRVSYREAFKDTMKVAEQVITEKNAMRARIEKLEKALHTIRHMWAGHAEECHFVTSRYKGKCDCDWPKIEAQCDSALSQDDQ